MQVKIPQASQVVLKTFTRHHTENQSEKVNVKFKWAQKKTIKPPSDVCRTFGSGVVQPFNGSSFYVRSSCPFLLSGFTHNRVECQVITQRDGSGLLVRVEIIVNKVRTVLQNGSIRVEGERSALIPWNTFLQPSNIEILPASIQLNFVFDFWLFFLPNWQHLPPIRSHLPAYLWIRHLHQAEELPDSFVCRLARRSWRNRLSLGVQTLTLCDSFHTISIYDWSKCLFKVKEVFISIYFSIFNLWIAKSKLQRKIMWASNSITEEFFCVKPVFFFRWRWSRSLTPTWLDYVADTR